MKCYSDLPQEVLLQIFGAKQLNPTRNPGEESDNVLYFKDLSECTMACKSWSDAARQVQFSHLSLTAHMKDQLLLLNESPLLGIYVKSLTLSFSGRIFVECINILQTLLPGVEILKWDGCDPLFYLAVAIGAIAPSKWKLKYIQNPASIDELKTYTTCAPLYKATLQNFFLSDSVGPCYDPDEVDMQVDKTTFDNLYTIMDHFPKLDELTIKRHTNDDIEAFDSIFEKCASLEVLDVGLYPDQYERSASVITENFNLSIIKQNPLVKSLDACLIIHHDNSLLYLMHKFSGLEYLGLNRNSRRDLQMDELLIDYLWGAPSAITKETFIQFMAYRMSIPLGETVLNVRPSVLKDALAIYSRLNSNRLWTIKITYDVFWDGNVDDEDKDISLLTIYPHKDHHQLDIHYNFPMGSGILSHLALVETMGSFIESFTFVQHVPQEEMAEDAYPMCNGYFLDHLFQHCNHLARLSLQYTTLTQLDSANPSVNNSIVDLDLSYCKISKEILGEISTRLPSLKILSLANCTFQNQDDTWGSTELLHINMPYTSFDRIFIKLQYSDRNHKSVDGADIIITDVFLQLTTTEGGKQVDTYYQLTLNGGQRKEYTVVNSEQDTYDNAMHTDITQLKVHLICKSVEKIDVSLRNLLFKSEGSIVVAP